MQTSQEMPLVARMLRIGENAAVPTMTLAERVRQRLREEKAAKNLSERDLAAFCQGWSQSKIAQKLGGRTPITLDELESLCFALSLMPSEAVRDRGFEFSAEMTPTELRMLEKYRALRPDQQQAVLTILGVSSVNREARPPTTHRKRQR